MARPNVLLLFADQHNAGVLGCENHPDVLTPQLDQLAERGTRFSQAYCQDGVCVPSRSSIFSGLYPRALGCLANTDRSGKMEEIVSLPAAFGANGYLTAAFGKRHLYLGCDEGWDIKASHLAKESPDDNYVQWIHEQGFGAAFDRDWAAEWARAPEGSPSEGQPMPWVPMCSHASQLPEETTMEAWTKRRTVEFIRARKNSDTPFFCFSSFYRPHQPYTPPASFYERFDRSRWGKGQGAGDGLAMPPTLRQPVSELPPLFQEVHAGRNRVFCLDEARKDEQLYRNYIAAYYALVEEIDTHIGEILHALDESGLRENTLVVYASDHGDFVGAHGMIEKIASGHNVYEEILRVPLIFNWPGVIGTGEVREQLTELVDLYPTLMDLCGLKAPALKFPLQGLSLRGVLTGENVETRSHLVSENWSQATVITDQCKLGIWLEPGNPSKHDFRASKDMLFDRKTDPLEINNVAGTSAYRETEKELRGLLHNWAKRMASCSPPFDAHTSAPAAP